MHLGFNRGASALVTFCFAFSASAAVHAVVPSCSFNGNGTNWTCASTSGGAGAYNAIPSTLTRGDIYYLADGTYGSHLSLNTAASGTLVVEFRKAQSYDFGGMTGWNTATMGAAQAVLAKSAGSGQLVTLGSAGNYLFNGNSSEAAGTIGCGGVYAGPPASMTSAAPTPSNCGIKIDDSSCTSTATDGCDGGSGVMNGGGANITWRNVEWFGQGLNSNGNNNSETYFWFASGGTLTNVTITASYLHNAGTTYLTVVSGGWNSGSFDHNYVWGLFDGSTNHGEAIQLQGSNSGSVVHHNIFRDQQTNGDMVAVITGTQSNMSFYDNVDFCSAGGTSTSCRHNDGVIGCFNSQTCANYLVYDNTFSFPSNCGWNVTGGPSTMTVKNNLWYNCGSVGRSGGTITIDYNTYLNSGQSAVGSHDVSSSSAPNPFVSSTNYNLASDNASWNNRTSLGSPYDTDFNGNPFTTDRGAYQYSPGGCAISSSSIGPYTSGQSVSQQFTASNCTASTFSISAGSLSGSNLTLSSAGLLSGIANAGTYGFTATYGTATDSVSMTINSPPAITTTTLAAGTVNVAYAQLLSTGGGTGAVTCAVTTGSLPPGLSLAGCTISGIATAASTYSFSVTPTDANGVSGVADALSMSVVIGSSNPSGPAILHTTFCGPSSSWPGTCTLSAPTTAGSRLVVVFSSYNSAGSTPVMSSITDGVDTFVQLPNARSINTSSATAWNDIWTANGVVGGTTILTITPSTSESGDAYVWEVQNAGGLVGCASLSSQSASATAVGPLVAAGANEILLSHLHPAPGGNPIAVGSPFTSDAISDQMAYAHYTPSAAGNYATQWTQTAATFATGSCAFYSVDAGLNPITSPNAIVH